jgi:uncharacterized membrane protein YhhN
MALNLRTWVLIAAFVAGTSYIASWDWPSAEPLSVAWKGAGAGLLGVYAALNASTLDGWLLAAVMALGAAGDMLLETSGLVIGGAVFFAGHLTAAGLYLRNPRTGLSLPDRSFGLALPFAIVALAWLLPLDRAGALTAAIYACGLGLMAGTAWISRFPRALTGLGALMFAASDLLIFYRTGRPIAHAPWIGLTVWGLYFAGQCLIAIGVVRRLSEPGEARLA